MRPETCWATLMRRKPPSVDEALQRGLVRSWCWMPQRQGPPLVEVWVREKRWRLSEAEAEAFAEGLMAASDTPAPAQVDTPRDGLHALGRADDVCPQLSESVCLPRWGAWNPDPADHATHAHRVVMGDGSTYVQKCADGSY